MVAGTARIAYTYWIPRRTLPLATRFRLTKVRAAILVVVLAAAGFGGWKATHRGPKPIEVQIAIVRARTCRPRSPPTARSRPRRRSTSRRPSPARSRTWPCARATASRRGSSCSRSTPPTRGPRRASSEASMQALLRELDSARANLEQARARLRRAEENHQAGIISDADLRARAHRRWPRPRPRFRAAERRVEQARADARRRARHALQDHGRARRSTASSPPGASRRARWR